MYSFAAVAYDDKGNEISSYYATLDTLPDAIPGGDPDTMVWWSHQGYAFNEARKDTRPPDVVLPEFIQWCRDLPGKVCVVGYPVTFDFMWLYWYAIKFVGPSVPFGFQGIDIKTMAWMKLGGQYKHAAKRNFPRHWFRGAPAHTHHPLDDARGQGINFFNIRDDTDTFPPKKA